MCDQTDLPLALQEALDGWAREKDCSCIDINDNTQFIRIWMISAIMAVCVCTVVTVPLCWCTSKRPPGFTDADDPGTDSQAVKRAKDLSPVRKAELDDSSAEDDVGPGPNLEKATEHLLQTSPTIDGKVWRPMCGTRLDQIHEIGGVGTELYFRLLRGLGICFIYMAAVTGGSASFNLVSNFVPDNGQYLAKSTVGNVGAAPVSDMLAPDHRFLILQYDGGCQGTAVSRITAIMGWLDFSSTLIFLGFVVLYRFYLIPEVAKQNDANQVTVRDYAVEIDCLPAVYKGMEEKDEKGRNKYEVELSELLCARVAEMRQKEQRGKANVEEGPAPKVKELTLVRNFNGRLHSVVAAARMKEEKAIAEYIRDEKKKLNLDKEVKKLNKQLDKLSRKITKLDKHLDKKLKPIEASPVVRAFAIMSCMQDKERLLVDYRFSQFFLLRSLFQCLARSDCLNRCCPMRKRFFKGRNIRVRPAPEPTNIIWENQDIPVAMQYTRRAVMWSFFIFVLIFSFVCIYVTNWEAKRNMASTSQRLGNSACDPLVRQSVSSSQYSCIATNATQWTVNWVVKNATSEEQTCYCGAVGYTKVLADARLFNGICQDWVIHNASGSAIGIACTVLITVINIVCRMVLLQLAEWEKPLSASDLNTSKMMKIFSLQVFNTGFVIFCVNFYPPDWVPFGGLIFVGEFGDSVRGWYSVVGAALLMNMLANAVSPGATNLVNMLVNRSCRQYKRTRVMHHAQLLKLYTNPPFDIASNFAQLLTTVFVTVTYSAGLPLLNLFAAAYMLVTYWTDKTVLLWGSSRPPAYDTQIPKDAAEVMLYAVPLHCMVGVWMLGQPCTFPSNPLGGTLASLTEMGEGLSTQTLRGNSTLPSGFKNRVTRESTWMLFALLIVLVGFYVLWTVLWILGGTVGEFMKCLIMFCCPRRSKTFPTDAAEALPWADAAKYIETNYPPASYQMERHPSFRLMKKYMRGTATNFNGTSGPTLESAHSKDTRDASPGARVPTAIAEGFLQALQREYVREEGSAVANFLSASNLSTGDRDYLCRYEELVIRAQQDSADAVRQAIADIAQKWGLQVSP